jgi:hypothetical protein
MFRRLTLTAAGIGVAGLLLTGCFPTGAPAPEKTPPASTQEAEMTDPAPVSDAVKAALPEALQVEVQPNQDGLTSGWVIDVEVPLGYVVTGDSLTAVLVSAWKASEPKPAFVKFNPWSTYEGKEGAIEAQRAADELGIDWSPSLSVGVNAPDNEIEKLAGE